MGVMRRTPAIAGAVLVSVLTVGGVAWANGSNETGSDAQKRDCPKTRPHFGWMHHGTAGKVTSVSASAITLVGRDGKSQTVKIDAKTKVYAGREQATVSALKTGWLAFVQKNDAGVAVSIRAADPAAIRRHFNHHRFTVQHNVAAGKITAVSGSSITLRSRGGKTATVKVNGSTRVFTRDGAVKLSALKAGWLAFAIRGNDGVAVIIRAADPSQFGDRGDHAPAASNSSL